MDTLITLLIWILEGMFAVGLVGSALVIVITTVEDIEVMFEKTEPLPTAGRAVDGGGGEA